MSGFISPAQFNWLLCNYQFLLLKFFHFTVTVSLKWQLTTVFYFSHVYIRAYVCACACNSTANHQPAALIGWLIPCDFHGDLIFRFPKSGMLGEDGETLKQMKIKRGFIQIDTVHRLTDFPLHDAQRVLQRLCLFPPNSTRIHSGGLDLQISHTGGCLILNIFIMHLFSPSCSVSIFFSFCVTLFALLPSLCRSPLLSSSHRIKHSSR